MIMQAGLWGSYTMPATKTMPKKMHSLGKLETLDDSGPAGAYAKPIDPYQVPLLCLAIIERAVRDVVNGQDIDGEVRLWLTTVGRDWLKAIAPDRCGDEGPVKAIFQSSVIQMPLDEERYLPEDR